MTVQTSILHLKLMNIFLIPERLISVMIRARQRDTQLQHQLLWYLLTSQNGKELSHLEKLLAEAKLPGCLQPSFLLPCLLGFLCFGGSSADYSLSQDLLMRQRDRTQTWKWQRLLWERITILSPHHLLVYLNFCNSVKFSQAVTF